MAFRGILPEAPSFSQQLARGLGAGISKGLGDSSDTFRKLLIQKSKNPSIDKSTLLKYGFSPEDADLYINLSRGGQTALFKDLLEMKKRGLQQGQGLDAPNQDQDFSNLMNSIMSQNPQMQQDGEFNELEAQKEESGIADQVWEELEDLNDKSFAGEDEGLTPSEKVKRESERYKTGLPEYTDAQKKLHTFRDTKNNLSIMKELAKKGDLPTGLGRINLDGEGNLRLPFAASADAQRFVKMVNEFSKNAKTTYGARVTNFDLQQYLKQFPNLLNSKEGMEQLIDHIEIVNDINSVFYKNLKNTFDKHGGVRKIDLDRAISIAEKKSEKQVDKLSNKLFQIGMEDELPIASKNKGKMFRDEETEEVFVSNGREWVKQ